MNKDMLKNASSPRICLILDNPLRDLDGLTLIAWHLAQSGAEAFIVPMYLQGFDIPAINPDIILVNYIRKNNIDLLKTYKKQGCKIAILDTEGVGEWWDNHANLLNRQKIDSFVDHYYCWGNSQKESLLNAQALPDKKVFITGCPRYDFIFPKWRSALPQTNIKPGYFLINTNFPVVNPQFSRNTKSELKTWVKTGWGNQKRAEDFANASMEIFNEIKDTVSDLANSMPEQTFVLRPHPFERIESYEDLAIQHPNILLRKEGTSLQWIAHSSALLHLNCFTAIEAGFMNIEALAFEWLNKHEISSHSSEPKQVSRNAKNINELKLWLKKLTKNSNSLPKLESRNKKLIKFEQEHYRAIDGESSERVAEALLTLFQQEDPIASPNLLNIGIRQRIVYKIRTLLGFRLSSSLKNIYTSKDILHQRANKTPSTNEIREIILRISQQSNNKHQVFVDQITRTDYRRNNIATYKTIRISKTRAH